MQSWCEVAAFIKPNFKDSINIAIFFPTPNTVSGEQAEWVGFFLSVAMFKD